MELKFRAGMEIKFWIEKKLKNRPDMELKVGC